MENNPIATEFSIQILHLHSDQIGGQSEKLWVENAQKIIILIPGARRNGEWTVAWKHAALQRSEQMIVMPLLHRRITPFKMVTGIGRDELIREKRSQIISIINRYPDKEVSIVCHSYGVIILGKILSLGISKKLDVIVLIGSILKRDKIAIFSENAKIVIADAGTHDLIASHLESYLPKQFERTSIIQFHSHLANVSDRRFVGGHSFATEVKHFSEYIIPLIMSYRLVNTSVLPKVCQSDFVIDRIRFIATPIYVIFIIAIPYFLYNIF